MSRCDSTCCEYRNLDGVWGSDTCGCACHGRAWTVTYETAVVRSGVSPTREEAERAAARAHDALVIDGLAPDKLAYHVEEEPR